MGAIDDHPHGRIGMGAGRAVGRTGPAGGGVHVSGSIAVDDLGLAGDFAGLQAEVASKGDEGCKGEEEVDAVHSIAPIISRPTNIRLISDVPAPISISLASRNSRATGASFRNPAPPIACTAWCACFIASSLA